MHPPLTIHKHPDCAEIIEKFKKCHEDHPIAKYWGVCNDLKFELDRCFRQEKVHRRKRNLEASKEFKEKLQNSKSAAEAAHSPSWTDILHMKESNSGADHKDQP